MRTIVIVASVLIASATAMPAGAADSARGIGAYGSFFAQPAPKKPVPPFTPNQPASARAAAPTIVCGMTLVPADPKFDSGIKRTAPDARRFPMKTVKPSICTR